ncbi:hypothetical protein JB92DRAFT_3025286 [Gautieria morchelliformis]|nr:hypothetical protein JB92DRAFT_3025286 [Gautieria morchelliformis]
MGAAGREPSQSPTLSSNCLQAHPPLHPRHTPPACCPLCHRHSSESAENAHSQYETESFALVV